MTRNPDLWHSAVALGADVIRASTYGERCVDAAHGRPHGRVTFEPGDPRQIRYDTHIGSAMPERISYDAATQTLYVGAGTLAPVPEAVSAFDVGGMNVVGKWSGYRKANSNRKRSSPLDDTHKDRWPSDWTDELIEMLSVLRRLTDLADAQRGLLGSVLDQPLITEGDFRQAGVLPPSLTTCKARRAVDGGLFDP